MLFYKDLHDCIDTTQLLEHLKTTSNEQSPSHMLGFNDSTQHKTCQQENFKC